jgi:hypothetical protein
VLPELDGALADWPLKIGVVIGEPDEDTFTSPTTPPPRIFDCGNAETHHRAAQAIATDKARHNIFQYPE